MWLSFRWDSDFLRDVRLANDFFDLFLLWIEFYGSLDELMKVEEYANSPNKDAMIFLINNLDLCCAKKSFDRDIFESELKKIFKGKKSTIPWLYDFKSDKVFGKTYSSNGVEFLKKESTILKDLNDLAKIKYLEDNIYSNIDVIRSKKYYFKGSKRLTEKQEHIYFEHITKLNLIKHDLGKRMKVNYFGKKTKEFKVLALINKLVDYDKYFVLNGYKPGFLLGKEIDIFIKRKGKTKGHTKLGVEYQGEQHFKAINAFGGEDSLKKVKKRDSIKKKLCDEHNIKLVYILYSEKIDERYLKELLLKNNIELKHS